MSILSRISLLFRAQTNEALDRLEDPRVMLKYAYEQQLELVRKVKQGLIEVATSKQQLQQEAQKLRARIPETETQAKRALDLGREDLARLALQRKQSAIAELEALDRQLAEVEAEQQKLTTVEQQLTARIEEFRTRRDITAARYTAAQSQVQVNEALSGVSGELAELSVALGRAEEKTEHMKARASAIDALIESGALTLPGSTDRVEEEIRDIAAARAVDDDLARLKAEAGLRQRVDVSAPEVQIKPQEAHHDH